jgi:hypothetical protein
MKTTSLAHSMQACFTSCMTTITSRKRSESIYDKAERILSEPERIMTIERLNDDFWRGLVRGDYGTYEVVAVSPRVQNIMEPEVKGRLACTCKAGWRRKRCAHMLIGEEMRLRGAK